MAKTNMSGFGTLKRSIEVWADGIEEQVFNEMEDIAFEGANAVQRMITDAHTETGLVREAAGEGEPGRVEGGDFRADVGYEVVHNGDTVTASWGWLEDDIPDYYMYQEEGIDGFLDGVHSLGTTLEFAADDLSGRLEHL